MVFEGSSGFVHDHCRAGVFGITEDAGGNGGNGDRCGLEFHRPVEAGSDRSPQKSFLVALAPHRTDCVDHPAAGQGATRRYGSIADRYRRKTVRLILYDVTPTSDDGTGDPAAVVEVSVGGVDNRVDLFARQVSEHGLQAASAEGSLFDHYGIHDDSVVEHRREGAGTLPRMRIDWNHGKGIRDQLEHLCAAASEPGLVVVAFGPGGDGEQLPWDALEPWSRSRAVTVAEIAGKIASPALDVALCADLVYLRPDASLRLSTSSETPAPGIVWALGRAGRRALFRGLMETGDLAAAEAEELGLANRVVPHDDPLPLPDEASLPTLTAARDLMRAGASGANGLALELASFRLLFAAGDPNEGARAFLEKRKPKF